MRTAQQILDEVQDGELEAQAITIRETARLTIRNVETGEVTEYVLSDNQLRHLRRTATGVEIIEPLAPEET